MRDIKADETILSYRDPWEVPLGHFGLLRNTPSRLYYREPTKGTVYASAHKFFRTSRDARMWVSSVGRNLSLWSKV